jgi:hypothetical protein
MPPKVIFCEGQKPTKHHWDFPSFSPPVGLWGMVNVPGNMVWEGKEEGKISEMR